MSESQTLKIAVVGYNMSSVMALRALKEAYPSFELKWIQTDNDERSTSHPLWLCWPAQVLESFNWDHSILPLSSVEWEMFWGRGQHEPLTSFVNQPSSAHAAAIPLAIRKKIESLAIWGDLSPEVWNETQGIDYMWTHKAPTSSAQRKSESFYLIPRNRFLDLQTPLELDQRYKTMALTQGEELYKHKLIYNAPFGSESFDRILWTSQNSAIRFEDDRNTPLRKTNPAPVARWRTWVAQIPENYASFLKPASVWLDKGPAGRYFLETGLFQTSCLYRAFRNPYSNHSQQEAQLQIEILEFLDSPLGTENSNFRPDSFLWDYCPFLQELNPNSWTEVHLDESWIYPTPFPFVQTQDKGLDFWSGGPLSQVARLVEAKGLWSGLPGFEKPLEKTVSPVVSSSP